MPKAVDATATPRQDIDLAHKEGALRDPERDRPHVPPSYPMPDDDTGMVDWSSARERLRTARAYWLVTVSADGTPHTAPIWGVWLDDRFYVEGDPRLLSARNIRERPRAIIHLDNSEDVVIVHGNFEDVPDVGDDTWQRITASWDEKYEGYRPPNLEDHGFYVLTPSKAFSWTEYPRTATRFRWREAPGPHGQQET